MIGMNDEGMTQEEAYQKICDIAREHALVLQAAGGVVTIVHPEIQKEEGLYEHIQYIHGLGDHPETIKRRKEAQKEE